MCANICKEICYKNIYSYFYLCLFIQGSHRTGKPGKMGRHFPVREKSRNFDQTGKVRENQTKYWKTEGISDKCYWLFVYYLLNLMKFSVKKKRITVKILENGKNTGKVREKSGNFVSPEKWEPCLLHWLILV